MTDAIYATREEFEADIARIREMPHMKALAAQHEADRVAMMERRAKLPPQELARLDREAMQKIEAWARGDLL